MKKLKAVLVKMFSRNKSAIEELKYYMTINIDDDCQMRPNIYLSMVLYKEFEKLKDIKNTIIEFDSFGNIKITFITKDKKKNNIYDY
jgi:hypothetical protein